MFLMNTTLTLHFIFHFRENPFFDYLQSKEMDIC
jgi:hypothetical protein